VLAELQAIMGTSVNPTIQWVTTGSLGGFPSNASWPGSGFSGTVRMNTSLLTESDPIRAFRVVAHELRHGYQFEAYNSPGRHIVSNRTIERWEFGWNNQVPQGAIGPDGWPQPAHMRSIIEWDAHYFAGQIRRNQYGRPDYYLSWYSPWPH